MDEVIVTLWLLCSFSVTPLKGERPKHITTQTQHSFTLPLPVLRKWFDRKESEERRHITTTKTVENRDGREREENEMREHVTQHDSNHVLLPVFQISWSFFHVVWFLFPFLVVTDFRQKDSRECERRLKNRHHHRWLTRVLVDSRWWGITCDDCNLWGAVFMCNFFPNTKNFRGFELKSSRNDKSSVPLSLCRRDQTHRLT